MDQGLSGGDSRSRGEASQPEVRRPGLPTPQQDSYYEDVFSSLSWGLLGAGRAGSLVGTLSSRREL